MLTLIEIGLVVAAWRLNWRAWALVPLVVALYVKLLLLSIAIELPEQFLVLWLASLIVDAIIIGVQVGMVAEPSPRQTRLRESHSNSLPTRPVSRQLQRPNRQVSNRSARPAPPQSWQVETPRVIGWQ